MFQIESAGASRTNALTLTFRGRLAGFRGTIQYMLSQNIDDASGVFDLPADNNNFAAERGRADFDRRHKFNLAGTCGWRKDRVRLGGVLALSSGAPFEILSGTDTNHDLVANDRLASRTVVFDRGNFVLFGYGSVTTAERIYAAGNSPTWVHTLFMPLPLTKQHECCGIYLEP